MTLLLLSGLLGSLGLALWLGYRLAAVQGELERTREVLAGQRRATQALARAFKYEEILKNWVRRLHSAADASDLQQLYQDITRQYPDP